MLQISKRVSIPDKEIDLSAIRSQGPGGQHVNKVSTAVQLRFDIEQSSLPDLYKKRLLMLHDRRITKEGVIVIKVQQDRSQKRNKDLALQRLKEIILRAMKRPKKRIKTEPTKTSQEKRLESKARRARIKSLRGRIKDID